MKWTVKTLLASLIENCFYDDPRQKEIFVFLFDRDGYGNVISKKKYRISAIHGSSGENGICIETSTEVE